MEIIMDGVSLPEKPTIEQFQKAATCCLEEEGIPPENIEVSLTFVDPDEIRELNASYRGMDNVTDVLSFPQFDTKSDIPKEGTALLGDVVICLDRALEQAVSYGHSSEREILFLFVHSMFHLLGYDHQCDEDQREMRNLEEKIMARIGLERR